MKRTAGGDAMQELRPAPSQWDIAKALRLNQSTVSRALQGDPRCPASLRVRVREMAARLGYRENPLVKALMTQVRTGRKPREQGVIALLVEDVARDVWPTCAPMVQYESGATRRASELGYRLERFFVAEDARGCAKMDGILRARGIRGVIVASPWHGNLAMQTCWGRLACVATGWSPRKQRYDLVANDYSCNMIMAFERLARLGYSRVGVILNPRTMHNLSVRWLPGFLECQACLPAGRRVPHFVPNHLVWDTRPFDRWLRRWKPDVVLSADSATPRYLAALKLKVPRDIGLAALGYMPKRPWAGVEEDHEMLGVRVVEQVTARIERNETGIAAHPTVTLVPGRWVGGKTLRRIGPPVPPPIAWEGDDRTERGTSASLCGG